MKQRKNLTPEQKTNILRELLENQEPASNLAERYGINVNDIFRWKKQLFENAPTILIRKNKKKNAYEEKCKQLEEKLKKKDHVISIIAQENIELKKNINGEI